MLKAPIRVYIPHPVIYTHVRVAMSSASNASITGAIGLKYNAARDEDGRTAILFVDDHSHIELRTPVAIFFN
jgi:hypothetical protein